MKEIKEKTVYFAKVRPTGKIPEKTEGNAGFDIYADFEENEKRIETHDTVLVPTAIAAAMSPDWYLQVEERGSTGSKGIKKSAGVIDSSYRGEIFIAITNSTEHALIISKNPDKTSKAHPSALVYPYQKAIAQLILHRVYNDVTTEEISYEDLKAIPSDRGSGKLGSSGK